MIYIMFLKISYQGGEAKDQMLGREGWRQSDAWFRRREAWTARVVREGMSLELLRHKDRKIWRRRQ